METKINDLTSSEKELEVTLSYDEIKDDILSEVKKQTKKIQLPGFRKGKVPLQMLKKIYGDALEFEASEKVANNRFWKIAEEKEIFPIGQPKLVDIKFNPNENLQFKVQYETYPVLEIKNYKGNEIEVPDFKVTDKEIDSEIEYIKKSNSIQEEAETVGDSNNFIIDVDLQRVDDTGKTIGDVEKIKIDLSNPGVNSEIIKNSKGKKIGESFNFSFKDETESDDNEKKTPEIFHYTAKINAITKSILPELTEDLIKKVTKDRISNEADLREDIKKNIQNYYDKQTDDIIKGKLISLIIEKNNFEPPNTLVNNILQDLVQREEEDAKRRGDKLFSRKEAEERLKEKAVLQVKWFLIKRELEQKEKIEVSDDELKKLAKAESEKTGLSEEKLLNYYRASNYKENLTDQKLFDFLKENTTIKKINPETISKKEEEETK